MNKREKRVLMFLIAEMASRGPIPGDEVRFDLQDYICSGGAVSCSDRLMAKYDRKTRGPQIGDAE